MVIGVDGTSDGYASIEKGEMTATVDTFPYQCGYYSVEWQSVCWLDRKSPEWSLPLLHV